MGVAGPVNFLKRSGPWLLDLGVIRDEGREGGLVSTDEREAVRASVLTDISNAMVRLYKETFGRGPTAARSYWCGENLLTVVLQDTLTPAERNLVALGEHHRLRETRMFFQYATIREFCAPVEQITGRKVRSFLSGTDSEVDGLSIEAFVLHPAGYDGPSRVDLVAA